MKHYYEIYTWEDPHRGWGYGRFEKYVAYDSKKDKEEILESQGYSDYDFTVRECELFEIEAHEEGLKKELEVVQEVL